MQIDRKIAIAPMLDWTDKHYRFFMRLITKKTLLYTEMITQDAILFGDQTRLLAFDPIEHPLALQLGGSTPEKLAKCAKIAAAFGYDEINLNIGCPSDRVQQGRFGACLMKQPSLVAECFAAMQAQVKIPVTLKTRIGVDEFDDYEFLSNFIKINHAAGCKIFIIHARKAWLKGLSPKQNRELPPLKYEIVAAIKRDFPDLEIILNGGIRTLAEARQHLKIFDGVMIGRAAYHDPYLFARVDTEFFQMPANSLDRKQILKALVPYLDRQLSLDPKLKPIQIVRHIMGLFRDVPHGQKWRRFLSQQCQLKTRQNFLENSLQLFDS